MTSTAIVTASYARDFERCALLCESVDIHLKGDWTHYLLVASEDVALFRKLEGVRRKVIDEADLLPRWLRSFNDPFSTGGRRVWLSPFSLPLRGWHVQQLRRLALCRHISEPAMLSVDSDVVLIRDFDPASLWRGDDLLLYRKDGAITASARSNHLAWLRHSDRLLGLPAHQLPAHDYISTLIAWRTQTARALLDHIETIHGCRWERAIIRTRAFSECIIYGRFADEVLGGRGHVHLNDSLCHVMWSEDNFPHDISGLRKFLDGMKPYHIAVGVQSFIGHDLSDIRNLLLRTGPVSHG